MCFFVIAFYSEITLTTDVAIKKRAATSTKTSSNRQQKLFGLNSLTTTLI